MTTYSGHQFRTRVEVRMTMPATKDNVKAMHNRGGLFLKKLKAVDKNARILPWKAAHRKHPALNTDRELKKISDLTKMDIHFNRARVLQRIDFSKKGEFARDMWFHVYLQHDDAHFQLLDRFNQALEGSNIFAQLMPIQHKNPQLLGYILGSTISTDIGHLNECLYILSGKQPMGGKWFRNIQVVTGRGRSVPKTATDRKSWIGAVHVFGVPGPKGLAAFRQLEKSLKIAEEKEASAKQEAIESGVGDQPATGAQFCRPLSGLKAKVLPDIRLVNNKDYQRELRQYREVQGHFLQTRASYENDEILDLYGTVRISKEETISLHDFMVSIVHPEATKATPQLLFSAINTVVWDGVVKVRFEYSEEDSEVGENYAKYMLSYLVHCFKGNQWAWPDIQRFCSTPKLKEAEAYKFDVGSKRILTPLDEGFVELQSTNMDEFRASWGIKPQAKEPTEKKATKSDGKKSKGKKKKGKSSDGGGKQTAAEGDDDSDDDDKQESSVPPIINVINTESSFGSEGKSETQADFGDLQGEDLDDESQISNMMSVIDGIHNSQVEFQAQMKREMKQNMQQMTLGMAQMLKDVMAGKEPTLPMVDEEMEEADKVGASSPAGKKVG